MYEETLNISISSSYTADEFIEDLKAKLEGQIDALLIRLIGIDIKPEVAKIEPKINAENIRVIREIMQRLNLS